MIEMYTLNPVKSRRNVLRFKSCITTINPPVVDSTIFFESGVSLHLIRLEVWKTL